MVLEALILLQWTEITSCLLLLRFSFLERGITAGMPFVGAVGHGAGKS